MGQFESTNCKCNSNDELINSLIKREYIHSINVEEVFRSVDRGLYYTDDNKVNAYRDTDWRSGDVHLCSPSDYATVLECLDLHKGHKFLNIGSGIGYFSTLAGLLLGVNGVNHGIEIHSSLIDIAYQKLEVFKQNSAAIDYFEFCEPVFIKGNACELMSVGYYDRVNCGAEVPPAESSFMKALIKIGGVLVMPFKGFLVKVTRNGEDSWKTIQVIEVSIPDLVVAEKCSSMKVSKFPTVEPLSLQELCRSNIRASIRNSLNERQPDLQMHTKCKPNKSYDQQLLDDTLSGMIRLQNYLNEASGWEEEISDFHSTSGNEAFEEDNDDDNNGDDVDVEEKDINEQCDKSLLEKTESDIKSKESETICSEQNKTLPEKPENTNIMRMNILSSTFESLSNNHSTNSRSDFLETMSNDSSEYDDEENNHNGEDGRYNDLVDEVMKDYNDTDEEIAVESLSNNHSTNSRSDFLETMSNDSSESDDEENNHNGEDGRYNDLVDEVMKDYNDTDEEIARELMKYRFLSNRKENELSKLLKVKINLLPVPAMLKMFLNYNKDD